jgi:hypothetical protein
VDARIKTLLSLAKLKEVKTGCNLTKHCKEGYGPNVGYFASDSDNNDV